MSNGEAHPPGAGALRAILREVAAGRLDPAQAEEAIMRQQVAEMGWAALDLQREARRGRPEVIYGGGKSADQIVAISGRMLEARQNVLITRIRAEDWQALLGRLPAEGRTVCESARAVHIMCKSVPTKQGVVGILAAGTSDIPVAEEAAFTAECLGSTVRRAYDVGVAGIHRLMGQAELLREARVLVAVAGMEGALPGVAAGLSRAPLIAVPTSVGYGAAFGGVSALLTMINGCSPGVSVVNIDNGFGAGFLADTINEIGEARGG